MSNKNDLLIPCYVYLKNKEIKGINDNMVEIDTTIVLRLVYSSDLFIQLNKKLNDEMTKKGITDLFGKEGCLDDKFMIELV